MQAFYERVVGELVGDGRLSPSARVLVVCGGFLDRDVLKKAGFANVTITNLDTRNHGEGYAPFQAATQDAEALSYADGEFEVAPRAARDVPGREARRPGDRGAR